MKNVTTYVLGGTLLFLLYSCSSDDAPTLSGEKSITEFKVLGFSGTIDEAAKTILDTVPKGSDLTSLIPTITISSKASVSPTSGSSQDFSSSVTYKVTAEDGSSVNYEATVEIESCAKSMNIYKFTYSGKNYELIRENKTWEEAVACAVERGGFLAEINDDAENTAIFDELSNNASISLGETTALDGGKAAYVWLGGNDTAIEGDWVWDGNNDMTSTQFWQGDASGSPVGGLYSNWGNEPDDFGSGQDGLALALSDWPLGTGSLGKKGQWNDIDLDNDIYYLIEYN